MSFATESPYLDQMIWVEGTDPKDACDYMFWCPGCETHHGIYTTHPNRYGGRWTIVSFVPLTIMASVLCFHYANEADRKADRNRITDCHLFVKNDQIQFLADCKHKLAGQTVPMVPSKLRD